MQPPRLTFGMIVLNGEPFIQHNLRALYPFAHQIIVVEGACPSARNVATPDGHSADSTLETLSRFKAEEDTEKKLIIITAENDGHADGFWSEKDEMSDAYARRATGDYLWQIDVDEFYRPQDMQSVIDLLARDPDIKAITFPMLTFWGGLQYRVDGFYVGSFAAHRVFAWRPGFRYATHRPPTVVDEKGRDLRTLKALSAKEMKRRLIYMYHYELLFPKQVKEKCAYYASAEWTPSLLKAKGWAEESYFSLKKPFRVHMVYSSISWLERFDRDHPPEVIRMVEATKGGRFPGIEFREKADIETLLRNHFYRAKRLFLRASLHLNAAIRAGKNTLRILAGKTFLLRLLRELRVHRKGGLIPIRGKKIPEALVNGWKASKIPQQQGLIVTRELSQMYEGNVIRPYKILADAVRATGCERQPMIEIGCATGYYFEALQHLLGHSIQYHGLDYSYSMVKEARRKYPDIDFQVADTTSLPYVTGAYDIVISGTVLLHVLDYEKAIAESARISRKWVIFHKTPVVQEQTRFFRKRAYGVPCLEIHFNEGEFLRICSACGLGLRHTYDISLTDPSYKTYVFERVEPAD